MATLDRNRLPVVAAESYVEATHKLCRHTRIRIDADHIVDIDPSRAKTSSGWKLEE